MNKTLAELPLLTLTNHWKSDLLHFHAYTTFLLTDINRTINIVNYTQEKHILIMQSQSTALAAVELNNH